LVQDIHITLHLLHQQRELALVSGLILQLPRKGVSLPPHFIHLLFVHLELVLHLLKTLFQVSVALVDSLLFILESFHVIEVAVYLLESFHSDLLSFVLAFIQKDLQLVFLLLLLVELFHQLLDLRVLLLLYPFYLGFDPGV